MVNKLSTYYINIYKSICGPFWSSNVDSSIEMSARGTASWVCSWMVIVPLQLAGALLMLRLNGHIYGKSWDVIFLDFKPTINMRIIEDIWYIYMRYNVILMGCVWSPIRDLGWSKNTEGTPTKTTRFSTLRMGHGFHTLEAIFNVLSPGFWIE